ncbi:MULTISPECIES: MlaD family protein [Pseudomonas]|uniref:MCE family protein n=1 Tax=Pseudomonas eucalypticola TaxID=2599595 RepID=A0A7D5D3Z1_9PSED|nr:MULTISPECIES: MlaD family protein [Pseudomonas]QKZ02357.1 MCE family protein [Pseudomonas eucalypticola]
METRAHHVLIGLFTVLIVLGGLLFGLWLAKSSVDSAFDDYEVVFNEAVTGLSRGSSVQYSGIKVGDVVLLRLDPQDPRRVLARIRLTSDVPIKQDTQAKLALNGITGTSIIQLSGGTPQSPALKGEKGALPMIIASPSPIARLLTNSNDLMASVNQLLSNANRLISSENVDRFSATLAHVEQVTGTVAEQRDTIRLAISQIAQASQQASGTLKTANGLLDQQGRQTLNSARQAMESLQHSAAALDTLLANNHDAVNGGLQGLNQLAPAIRELRDTLTALKAISQRLQANPSGYLLGRDRDKEFEP